MPDYERRFFDPMSSFGFSIKMNKQTKGLVGLSLATVLVLSVVAGTAFMSGALAAGNAGNAGNSGNTGAGNMGPGGNAGNAGNSGNGSAGNGNAGNGNNDNGNAGGAASVVFTQQSVDCNASTVVVDSVTLPNGGYVVIHNSNGDVVGHSDYLSAGTHENVTVTLDTQLTTSQKLTAMAHKDTNGNQQYDSGETNDTPYMTDGSPVTDVGCIQVAADCSCT